nr:MAG TPA: hypothetical protein [Bacteriophage sp.]
MSVALIPYAPFVYKFLGHFYSSTSFLFRQELCTNFLYFCLDFSRQHLYTDHRTTILGGVTSVLRNPSQTGP